jgi:hypothetical protein
MYLGVHKEDSDSSEYVIRIVPTIRQENTNSTRGRPEKEFFSLRHPRVAVDEFGNRP